MSRYWCVGVLAFQHSKQNLDSANQTKGTGGVGGDRWAGGCSGDLSVTDKRLQPSKVSGVGETEMNGALERDHLQWRYIE